MSEATASLNVEKLRTGYGKQDVVFEASLKVGSGEIVALCGHNGAGKSTILKAILGVLPVNSGKVELDGADVTKLSHTDKVRRGLCMIPEDDFVFRALTVDENLALGGFTASSSVLSSKRAEVFELLPVLEKRLGQQAGTLSGGEQRMLSLGMALMSDPRLLLLDEPSLGLAPSLVENIMKTISQISEEKGLSVLMVEQNIEQALHVAGRMYVMRAGELIIEESSEEMMAREEWWDLF